MPSFRAVSADIHVPKTPTGTLLDGLANMPTAGPDTRISLPRSGEITPTPDGKPKNQHTIFLGLAYVNEVGRSVFSARPYLFPAGTIIVREKLRMLDGPPVRLLAMIKHEPNFNRKSNGWEFVSLSGDATRILSRDKDRKCLKCHTTARDDFVFPEDGRYR